MSDEESKVRDVSDQFGDNPYADDVEYSEMAADDPEDYADPETGEFRLHPDQVRDTFSDCLFETKEEAEAAIESGDAVQVEGIVWNVVFKKAKLDEHAELIMRMLMELPEAFRQTGGGGWSFLNACDDRHGNQWTSFHETMGMLFMMGMAIDKVTMPIPREMWNILPGGMPYYVVMDRVDTDVVEVATTDVADAKSVIEGSGASKPD